MLEPMRSFRIVLAAVALCAPLAMGQDLPEFRMFVADRGDTAGGSDGGVYQFTVTGDFLNQVPNFGSGPIRSIAVGDNNDLYVARGNAINVFTASSGYSQGATFALGTMAQDVAVHPVTGNVWCSFGVSSSSAMVLEVTQGGTTLQTITDPLLAHPRAIEFDLIGNNLYVANATGFNVLLIDSTPAVTSTVSVFATETDLGTSFNAIGVYPSRIQDQFVTVVGDYGDVTQIRTVIGTPGNVTVTTLLDYSTTTDLLAPAGGAPDSYGNIYIAGRNKNSGSAGIYVLREDTGTRTVGTINDTQLLNPIGVAFRRTRVDTAITSLAGTTANGFPRVVAGGMQLQTVGIDISAPEFPNAGYAIFFSAVTNAQLIPLACQRRPLGTGISLASSGDPRFLPLDNTDAATIGDSLNIFLAGGNGPFTDPCGVQNGSAARFLGGLDALGQANAELIFPALSCVPPPGAVPNEVIYAFTVLVFDGVTAPAGVGAMSTYPECLILELGP